MTSRRASRRRAADRARADQLRSAGAQVLASLKRVVDADPDWTLSPVRVAALPLTLRLLMWEAINARPCVHLLSGPQPVHAVAWRPGLLACTRCSRAFGLPKGSEHDLTCDACGSVEPSVTARVIGLGPLVFGLGLCGDCRRRWSL